MGSGLALRKPETLTDPKEGKEKLKKGVKTLFQGAKKKLKKVGEDVGGVITGDKKINIFAYF